MKERKEYQYKIEPCVPHGYNGYLYSNMIQDYYIVAKGYLTKRGCRKAILKYLKREEKNKKREIQQTLHGTIVKDKDSFHFLY